MAVAKSDGVDESVDPSTRSFHLEIFLMSFAALLLEIAYTRIVSYKLSYYYTYLVIGLALLGIGSGGVFVAISGRLRRASTDAIVMWGLITGGVSVGIGYVIVALIRTNSIAIFDYGARISFTNLARLGVICFFLFASFVAVGIMLATLFGRRSEKIGRLYFADLLGAGIACVVVVTLLRQLGPPATIVFAGMIMSLAGLRLALRHPTARAVGALGAAAMIIVTLFPSLLPYQRIDVPKGNLTDSGHYYAWSPLFRYDAVAVPAAKDNLFVLHDGLLGSQMNKWNGKLSSLKKFHYQNDPRVVPFAALGGGAPDELIIGAAGGNEILASLFFKSKSIDAIEVNPATYTAVTQDLADFNGHVADAPGVNYVLDEGRSYLARRDEKYNLIWYPAPDSYSATNAATAGAFVLSESYLYTSEAVQDSLDHLRPGGVITTQFGEVDYDKKPTRTARYITTARDAMSEVGIKDPSRHIIVITSPTEAPASLSTILLSRSPFTAAQVDRVKESLAGVPGAEVRYAPGDAVPGDPATKLATLKGEAYDRYVDDYPFEIKPVTDNKPFFWHFESFGNVVKNFGDKIDPTKRIDLELGVGERVLLVLLAVAALFAIVFLLLPFLTIKKIWTSLPKKTLSAVYFGALGLGFIFFEITLIQRLTLFLGYPTLSLTVTLASLLLATGVGALLSGRYTEHLHRVVQYVLAGLVLLTAFYLFVLPSITDSALGWPIAARVAITFLILVPLGIGLGTFMPAGLGTVGGLTEFPREYVAWGWAVNGFASVVGSVLSTILAMTFGFGVVLVIALALYVVAVLALQGLLRAASTGRLRQAPAPSTAVG